ncbi:MAG: saccharopine dehydrogenase C-terminal domain-containing protein [Actinomycetota bacterium]
MTLQFSATARHPRRTLVLGCGSVAQCTIPILIRDLGFNPRSIHIVDFRDNRARVAGAIAQGVIYEQDRVTKENLDSFLSARVGDGDILLDLAWNIDCPTILEWCRDHGVRYLNTSVELWDPYHDMQTTTPQDRTLYVRHQSIRKMIERWGSNSGPSAVVEHGANPGMVSHLVKRALVDITTAMLNSGLGGANTAGLQEALAAERFNVLAQLTGTKVIHIAERDTQITNRPKEVDEFCNTWSVEGFYEEGIAPAEIGWGTHEKWMPANAHEHHDDGPRNQICLAQPGMESWVRSWVPSGQNLGMIIRHGESYTMCKHLTVKNPDGTDAYRPTVHYAYHPSDVAITSVLELRMRNWEMQPRERILNDEIVSGRDELGVLLMGHPFRSWWTGSTLSIDEARSIVPGQSATTLQVAGSVAAAVRWLIDCPNEGVCVPDDLPWKKLLDATRPYIGEIVSIPADWTPLSQRFDPFPGFGNDDRLVDHSDPWQFANFLAPTPR